MCTRCDVSYCATVDGISSPTIVRAVQSAAFITIPCITVGIPLPGTFAFQWGGLLCNRRTHLDTIFSTLFTLEERIINEDVMLLQNRHVNSRLYSVKSCVHSGFIV